MTTEIISKQGDLFSEDQVEGIAVFIPCGLTAIRVDAREFVQRKAGQRILENGIYPSIYGGPVKYIVISTDEAENLEDMQKQLFSALELFRQKNLRSIAMNGIRCDNRPDESIRPEKYQRAFLEAWMNAHPDVFDKITLVDLRGGFNR